MSTSLSINKTSVTPTTTSATSLNDASTIDFDGQSVNANMTQAGVQKMEANAINGEDMSSPATAVAGADFAAGGLLINSETGAVDGIDYSAPSANNDAMRTAQAGDTFSQPDAEKLANNRALAELRSA